jgi:hypothetical protein
MFFDEVPPNTSVYMVAGYLIFFVVTAIYVASLFIRERNLARDLETLKEAEQEQSQPVVAAPPSPRARPKPRTAKSRTSKGKAATAKRGSRKSR